MSFGFIAVDQNRCSAEPEYYLLLAKCVSATEQARRFFKFSYHCYLRWWAACSLRACRIRFGVGCRHKPARPLAWRWSGGRPWKCAVLARAAISLVAYWTAFVSGQAGLAAVVVTRAKQVAGAALVPDISTVCITCASVCKANVRSLFLMRLLIALDAMPRSESA